MHCVDLGESFSTNIYLQTLASIQPRTSRSKLDSQIVESASQHRLPPLRREGPVGAGRRRQLCGAAAHVADPGRESCESRRGCRCYPGRAIRILACDPSRVAEFTRPAGDEVGHANGSVSTHLFNVHGNMTLVFLGKVFLPIFRAVSSKASDSNA